MEIVSLLWVLELRFVSLIFVYMTRGFYAIEIRDSNEARELAEMLKDEPVFCVSLERLMTGNLGGYKRLLWDEDQWTLTNWVDNKTVINLEQVKQLILI